MKNCKRFYKAQAASLLRRLFSLSPHRPRHQMKSYYVFRTKIFWRICTEISRHLLWKCFKKAVFGPEEIMQCAYFFLTPNRNVLAGKLVNSERLWLCSGSMLLSMPSELRLVKWVRLFGQNCIVKWVIVFASFC